MNNIFDNRETSSRLGYLLIGISILFLATQWFGFNLSGILWNFFVIAPGAAFLYFAITGDEDKAGLAFPGAIITGTGLILLYQNLTGHWESWAYVWTLYPAFVGWALQFNGSKRGNDKEIETGREMIRWSMFALAIGFVFFELLIFGNFGGMAVWLLAGGVLLLVLGRNKHSGANSGAYIPKQKYSSRAYTNGTGEKRKHDVEEII